MATGGGRRVRARRERSDHGGEPDPLTGYDAITSGGTATDGNGHGTHVAGTVGGATYGIAKSVTLYAVRVLGNSGSGTTSGIISGVDWVTAHHSPTRPSVANMSLGGSASTALDNAVANSIAGGVTYCIYWRVNATNLHGTFDWSSSRYFTTRLR